ncbi:MAG: hypothetical protein EOO52_05680 [Gammaproteobacteria bacterium]|nr:MAG: hypothetical protein EOO52_05680 [Gammaproteobacteria bacterium]
MKKNIFVAFVSILSATSAYAADFGLGVDIKDDAHTIYVPINVSEGFRIEPYFSNHKLSQDDPFDSRESELGVGFFKVSEVAEKTNMVWGLRGSYIDGKYYHDEFDGYSVAPVLGLEYFPVSNVSVGADVSYSYRKVEGDSFSGNATSSGTKTAVSVKFYF